MTSFRDVLNQNRRNIEAVALRNTHVNEDGYATISKSDPWFYEDEWDTHYEELTKAEHRPGVAVS